MSCEFFLFIFAIVSHAIGCQCHLQNDQNSTSDSLTLLGIRTRLSAESAGLFPSWWTCSARRPARGKVVRLGRKAASGLAWLFGSKEFSETESEFFAY